MITAEQRRAIEATIPPGVEMPVDFWTKLDQIHADFRAMRAGRTERPPAVQRKKFEEIEKQAEALRRLIADTLGSRPVWDHVLKEMADFAETGRLGYEMLAASKRGRADPHVEMLYDRVLQLWRFDLGQFVGVSTSADGKRGGPMLKFFSACVAPVLGDASPKPETVRDIARRLARHKLPGMGF